MEQIVIKKKRSISKDRRAWLQQKHEERNWGTGSSKREQFYRDREVSLTAGELTLAEERQQVDADKKRLKIFARLRRAACNCLAVHAYAPPSQLGLLGLNCLRSPHPGSAVAYLPRLEPA